MSASISDLDMHAIREHFIERECIHKRLRKHLDAGEVHEYVLLALGISDRTGNYSASEHGLGHQILSSTTEDEVFNFAEAIDGIASIQAIPDFIYEQSIPYLKISVGTEAAMMLRPTEVWVGNIRTIWAHLLIKHDWNLRRANDELHFYRAGDHDSEIHYSLWREIYLTLESSMRQLDEMAIAEATRQGVKPGHIPYIWADAVANALYKEFSSSK